MYNVKLIITKNMLDSASPFAQGLVLENDYYNVRITYTDYKTHKANGTIDKSFISINSTPFNEVCTPRLTGTGNGILISFRDVAVSSQDGIDDVKEGIEAAESTIKQIMEIIEEYFTN